MNHRLSMLHAMAALASMQGFHQTSMTGGGAPEGTPAPIKKQPVEPIHDYPRPPMESKRRRQKKLEKMLRKRRKQ